ncbi:flavodoxin family protein [Denitrobacterium detoxificans]|jgi:multimeric flavodoxin WrbA|uniref:flavodoxin family protein n=1 Tax=Denitrobacterium detoxificans TaxID=79604 RepID=UPI0026F09C04|nr:NAD(P)H-dependent oxidoreductase [Denitrobacterium detoxificans]MBE6465554.1 flavodoxin family protein [Denitrobacterium detoxificans]
MAERTIICASPRLAGRSASAVALAEGLLAQRFPQDALTRIDLAGLSIGPCIGCDACREAGACFQRDDMDGLLATLARTDELFIASPVYFAGPPAGYKALLDRLQPLYWGDARHGMRRPAHLLAVGEGGDPYGWEPLATCTRSALHVAGFNLQRSVGCIGAQAPLEEYVHEWLGMRDGVAPLPSDAASAKGNEHGR